MERVEDVVIVGAGIAGLTTALGLHRLGIRSLVLESSANLRVSGFAFTTWTNAWRALDAIGVADLLREKHGFLEGLVSTSTTSGKPGIELSYKARGRHGDHEVRCVKRNLLLEALERELPTGTIWFSSKVVSIDESGYFKLVHLADGAIIKAKVLIGCDGVNSVVAKWLGFKKLTPAGRLAIRGYAEYKGNHGFGDKYLLFFGGGVRSGFLHCDNTTMFWFFNYTASKQDQELAGENPAKMKEFVLNKLGNVPDRVRAVVEATDPDTISSAPLKYRYPWDLMWGSISKGNVCIAGDALHPMTPEIGQGGCVALEDGVVLARCLGETLTKRRGSPGSEENGKEDYRRIEMALKKYARERRWRSIDIITTSYMVGSIQQSDGRIVSFFRDTVLDKFLARLLLKKADFDCGKLQI